MQPSVAHINRYFPAREWKEKASTSLGNMETTLTKLATRMRKMLKFEESTSSSSGPPEADEHPNLEDEAEVARRMRKKERLRLRTERRRLRRKEKLRSRSGSFSASSSSSSSSTSSFELPYPSVSRDDEEDDGYFDQHLMHYQRVPVAPPSASAVGKNNNNHKTNSTTGLVAPAVSQHQPSTAPSARRPPRIGQLPRHAAFDEDDLIARKNQTNAKNHVARATAAKDHFYLVQSYEDAAPSSETASNGDCELSPTSSSSSSSSEPFGGRRIVRGGLQSDTSDADSPSGSMATLEPPNRVGGPNNKPGQQQQQQESLSKPKSMIGSFTSVIEKSTRELSLSDVSSSGSAPVPPLAAAAGARGYSKSSPAPNPAAASSQASSRVRAPPPPALVALNPQTQVPIPTKCSAQLRRLIHSHSLTQPPSPLVKGSAGLPPIQGGGSCPASATHLSQQQSQQGSDNRPIFPNLPYSPYGSPNSSPRVRRKPLRETKRVDSITEPGGDYVQLNQYKLKGAIGQGSYGIVKLAYNKEDDSHYAMKILSKKKLKRRAGVFGRGLPNRKAPGGGERKIAEDPLQKVYREIAIMKKLDHPNVVRLFEVLDDPEEDNLYMVFELLEGGEVLQVPTDTPMDEKAAWLAFRDVVLGMEYLHYQKIIHRDIKPSNLLRTPNGLVKMADLGVSNEFDGADAYLTNTAGTPAFTPPESISHKPGDDPWLGKAADIWSLGVTLYALVTGNVPFHEDNIVALYNKIRTAEFTFPADRDLSPELKELLRRMLVKEPGQRITLPEIKQHDWVTGFGLYPLASEEENCELVEVTEKEVDDSIRSVPKLDTLILVKSMIKNHSFTNPFTTIKDRFQNNGRSNSAPEVQFYEPDSAFN